MSDLFYELLVKKEHTAKDSIIKYGLIAAIVVSVAAGLVFFPAFALAIGLGIASYFILPKTDLEYEYLYLNGELDIDMVMAKSKRKKVKSINMEEVDLVAPLTSHRLDYHNSNSNLKKYDFSSGNVSNKRFGMITKDEKGVCMIIIEPDDRLANMMKNTAPSKVFLD